MFTEEEVGQKLIVVSFIHREQVEKQGKYNEYEARRVERNLKTLALNKYVNNIFGGEFHPGTIPITFSNQDLEAVELPHIDTLIIKHIIANAMVSRVLVDGGSSPDILF